MPAVRRPHRAAAVVVPNLSEGQKTPLPALRERPQPRCLFKNRWTSLHLPKLSRRLDFCWADNQGAATGGICPALMSKSGGLRLCSLLFAGLSTMCPPQGFRLKPAFSASSVHPRCISPPRQ